MKLQAYVLALRKKNELIVDLFYMENPTEFSL